MPKIYHKTRRILLGCRFCNRQAGSIDLPLEVWGEGEITYAQLGIDDLRCNEKDDPACALEHGRYSNMEEEARHKGLNDEEFRAVMLKCNYSKKTFDIELGKKVKENKTITIWH